MHHLSWSFKPYKLLISIISMTGWFTCCAFDASGQDNTTYLKGNVQEQNYLGSGKSPSLNLRDLKDSFGAGTSPGMPSIGEGESFEPPPDAFNLRGAASERVASAAPPGLAQPNMNDFKGAQGVPGLDSAQQPYNLSADARDPDESPELQLAWDEWHKRVANAVYNQFNSIAQMAFKYSKPLACYITYTVTRDGRITNISVPQKSPNVAFNAMALLVINNLSGQTALLAFPPGSRRNYVNKAAMFTQNYGVQGFRYATGDKERLLGR